MKPKEALKEVKRRFCNCLAPNEQQKMMRYTPSCTVELALDYYMELLKHGKKAKARVC